MTYLDEQIFRREIMLWGFLRKLELGKIGENELGEVVIIQTTACFVKGSFPYLKWQKIVEGRKLKYRV